MKFTHINSYKEYVTNVQNKKIILFGVNDKTQYLLNNYFQHGEVFGLWDNNPEKNNKIFCGYTISLPPKELTIEESNEYLVIITVVNELGIISVKSQLEKLGIKYIYTSAVVMQANTIERYNADYSKKFHEQETFNIVTSKEKTIEDICSMLADEKSLFVYKKIVENRKFNIMDYSSICDDVYDHYFSDGFFKYTDNEVFVDCGAFLAEDTIRLYNLIGPDKLKKIYCFEPDSINFNKCEKNLISFFNINKFKQNDNSFLSDYVDLYKAGLWDLNSELSFCNFGNHSSVFAEVRNATSNDKIQSVRLDDLLVDVPVTLIKMDIEGAELKALKGAELIIKKFKPKLAICIYHMTEDLWSIPLYLKTLVPKYKFYVRHHTPYFWDSVLYAQYED